MTTENTAIADIANKNRGEYARSASGVLGISHEAVWFALEKFFWDYEDRKKVLLVVGPGRDALPYSFKYDGLKLGVTNRERVKRLGLDSLVFLDYIGLDETFKTLGDAGFFDKGFFKRGPILTASDKIRFEDIVSSAVPKIIGVQANLVDNLPFPSGIASAVESNLASHHVTTTIEETERVYREFFRILHSGGMLHLGEGNVEMNTEEPLVNIGNHISEVLKRDFLMSDERELPGDLARKYFFGPNQTRNQLESYNGRKINPKYKTTVRRDGLVSIQCEDGHDAEVIRNSMIERGFRQSIVSGSDVLFPIVDRKSAVGREYVHKVDRFYSSITNWLISRYSGEEHADLVARCKSAINAERDRARRGVGEYYCNPEGIFRILEGVGFRKVRQILVGGEESKYSYYPFYNLTAFKP